MLNVYLIKSICFPGSHLISEGQSSDDFFFFTLTSSPPSSLQCDTTVDSLTLKWRDPTNGMVPQKDYIFGYSVVAVGMYHIFNR